MSKDFTPNCKHTSLFAQICHGWNPVNHWWFSTETRVVSFSVVIWKSMFLLIQFFPAMTEGKNTEHSFSGDFPKGTTIKRARMKIVPSPCLLISPCRYLPPFFFRTTSHVFHRGNPQNYHTFPIFEKNLQGSKKSSNDFLQFSITAVNKGL